MGKGKLGIALMLKPKDEEETKTDNDEEIDGILDEIFDALKKDDKDAFKQGFKALMLSIE